ncbi:MAG: molybdenum cofactor biosynthesis protein MoaE [Thermoproteota archaeon]|nr:molybdenum cofactor biosynthesis protein MoaE [Thermoproteota archaeon]
MSGEFKVKQNHAKRITVAKIQPHEILNSVKDKNAGATAIFFGTVREHSEMGKIIGMTYESYLEMAEDKMKKIENILSQKWNIKRVRMIHRVGNLSVGDVSIAVAVSAPHRSEAFSACRYAIEKIKREVPIWKKEKIVGGKELWVKGLDSGKYGE